MVYGKSCNKDSDCNSNICKLQYDENEKPLGRFCEGDQDFNILGSDKEYDNECEFNRDCDSGACEPIYDKDGEYLMNKCVKAPEIKKGGGLDDFLGETSDGDHGVINSKTVKLKAKDKGPIAEIIILVFSYIADLFNIVVFNFRVCSDNYKKAKDKCGDGSTQYVDSLGKCKMRDYPCNILTESENHGMIYGIILKIFKATLGKVFDYFRYGIFFGGLQKKNYDSCKGKCKTKSTPVSLWFLRTIITILFPPMGVFMAKGLSGISQIGLSCLLTLCLYVPGLIYSLAVIKDTKHDYQPMKSKNQR